MIRSPHTRRDGRRSSVIFALRLLERCKHSTANANHSTSQPIRWAEEKLVYRHESNMHTRLWFVGSVRRANKQEPDTRTSSPLSNPHLLCVSANVNECVRVFARVPLSAGDPARTHKTHSTHINYAGTHRTIHLDFSPILASQTNSRFKRCAPIERIDIARRECISIFAAASAGKIKTAH